jgi:putative aldouronate transport system permease protein
MGNYTIKKTSAERIFDISNITLLSIAGLVTLLPIIYVLAGSLSDKYALINMKVTLWPIGLQFENYKMVLKNDVFWNSFKNTIIIVFTGTTLNMLMTVLTAYPLSKGYLKGRKYFMLMIVITMVFSAPMIPTYLVVKQLGLIDTLGALIIPGALSSFNLILCLTFFKSIPEELFEAARIDGMPEIQILWKIAIPVSLPMIVTLTMFYAVGHWNAYSAAIIYITKQTLKPLQVFLYTLISQYNSAGMDNLDSAVMNSELTPEGLKMATIMVATIPIVIVYPFIQKYFIKGAMLGSVKE